MTKRSPISLVRAGIQMAQKMSKKRIAEQLSCSKALVSSWRKKFRDSGHLLSEVEELSDKELSSILYRKKPIRFFPWESDEELCRELEQSHLSIRAFYKTIYLPKVPVGVKPMAYSSFCFHIHPKQTKSEVEAVSSLDAVQCFDLSNKVSVNDLVSPEVNQVRITLANGASIDFYPGSASESFVSELLRQNGVKI